MGTMLALFQSCGTLPSIEVVITSQIGYIYCSLYSFSVQPDTPSGPIAFLTSRFPNNMPTSCYCTTNSLSPSCASVVFGSINAPSTVNTDLKLSFITSLSSSAVWYVFFPFTISSMVSFHFIFSFIYL